MITFLTPEKETEFKNAYRDRHIKFLETRIKNNKKWGYSVNPSLTSQIKQLQTDAGIDRHIATNSSRDGLIYNFHDCCGANILYGFGHRESSRLKSLPEAEAREVMLRINYLLKTSPNKLSIAILNDSQQKLYKPIFESMGGQLVGEPAMGHHRKKLWTWQFVKGPQKRAAKRVFGLLGINADADVETA